MRPSLSKLASILSLSVFALPASANLADELKSLLAAGDAKAAYRLANQNPDALGDPLVDFYFGIAATDSGRADEGALSLERYILNFPGNVAARLEFARALFIAGDEERARDEFVAVRPLTRNKAEQATVDRYLEAIQNRSWRYRPSLSGHIELGLGHDSNANGGLRDPNITLPVLGPVTILDAGVRKSTTFRSVDLGLKGSTPIAPGLLVVGQAIGYTRMLDRHDTLDQLTIAANAGLAWLRGDMTYTLTASRDQIDVDAQRFRTLSAANLSANWQVDDFQTFGATLQSGELDYSGDNALRDARLQSMTLNWRRAFIHPLQPVASVQASLGEERNQRDRPDLGRNFSGGRVALAITPAARWQVSAGYSITQSTYRGEDPTLLTARRDQYQAVDLNAAYRLDKQWSLKGTVISSRNDSNLPLYEFQRHVAEFKLRYDY